MPTLRRILKYTPAVVMGLLVVAWVLSWFYEIEFGLEGPYTIGLYAACLTGGYCGDGGYSSDWQERTWEFSIRDVVGEAWFVVNAEPPPLIVEVAIPLLLCMTGLFPLAVGPFISFRFQIWHYLAYTALSPLNSRITCGGRSRRGRMAGWMRSSTDCLA
jgi:hypothetical protein